MNILNLINENGCSCGKAHKTAVKKIYIEKGAIKYLPRTLKEYNAKTAFVLADTNTFAAAGEKVCAILENSGVRISKYIFTDNEVLPDETSVGSAVMHFDSKCDVIVAVGSGVINDIGKILSAVSNKPYFVVATAPSMDGYASSTSSMTMGGLKISLASRCPDIIIGDLDILSNAPMRMLLSGLGDMLAKYISICEWNISHLINNEYYCENIAQLVRVSLKKCVDNAEGLLNRNEIAVQAVFEGLVFCGLAMSYAGVSRPASGVEHYISHVIDMHGVEFGSPIDMHGIQCAVGTLLSAQIYEQIKVFRPDKDKALKYVESFDYDAWSNHLKSYLGKGAQSMIELETEEKKYDIESHKKRLEKLIENWDNVIEIINHEIPALEELKKLYNTLGMPKTLEEIGTASSEFPIIFKATKDIRDKYVLSRLCWDLGISDEIVL